MKNNIIPFVLGVVATLIIAASTITETITVPRKPTHTFIKSYYFTNVAIRDIEKKVKEGYIVKVISGSFEGGLASPIIVVMEKY